MTRLKAISLCACLGGMLLSLPALGKPEIGDAIALRHGAAQRAFLASFLAAKQQKSSQLVQSLVASGLMARASKARPSFDMSALARNPDLVGDVWLDLAEALYANEQYEAAAQALGEIPEIDRRARSARIDALRTRLALRGFGKFPSLQASPENVPEAALNQTLVVLRTGGGQATALTDALRRLKWLADGQSYPTAARHRAMLWIALLQHQAGQSQEAARTLARIPGDSPFLAEALLAYLRINADLHPSASSAVASRLAALAPDSLVALEGREQLIRGLHAKGASAQAIATAFETIASIAATLTRLDQQIGATERMPVAELSSLFDTLGDGHRQRAITLRERRKVLLAIEDSLKTWRPYLDAYQARLRQDASQLTDEIQAALATADMESRRRAKSNQRIDLFDLGLSKVIGVPPEANNRYRLFFGLALWEFEFEYPENWQPAQEKVTKEMSRSKRRKLKEEREGIEQDDEELLTSGIQHAKSLLEKVDASLAKLPRFLSFGMADKAKSLLERNQAILAEIQRTLPALDAGVRNEVVAGLKSRKQALQQWMNRISHHALSIHSEQGAGASQPYYDIGKTLVLAKGEPFVRGIESVAVAVGNRKPQDADFALALSALKASGAGAETREIRAEALRLRARMTVALVDVQAISSASDAVDHYAELLKNYSDLIDRADTTYQLARAQDLAQRMEQSLATLSGFVKSFPADSRVGEAQFRIGETQFSLAEYAPARAAYEAVVRGGDKRYLDQAEYKLAWTLFKLGEYREALPRFMAVIDRASGAAGSDRQRADRARDAIRAASLTFASVGGAPEVERYFERVGTRPYAADIYHALAAYYLSQNRINDGATTYGILIKRYPDDASAPTLLADLVARARKENLARLSIDLQKQYVDRYAKSGAYWNKAPEPLRQSILVQMQPLLTELAQVYHADAQQQRTNTSYAKAIQYYSQFLDTYPNSDKAPHFLFLMAEARFESGDLRKALDDYEKVAYGYGVHRDAAEAGYAALTVRQKLAELEKDVAARKTGIRALVASSGRFVAAFPADTRADAVLAKAGEDILMLGEAAEAVRFSESLLARKSSDAVRQRARIVLAHALFESASFAKAETAYRELLATGGHAPAVQGELKGRLGLSVYRQAEGYRAAGNLRLAIDTFLRVAKSAPGSEVVPNAEIDASALLLTDKRWGEAVDVLERFRRNFPDNRFVAEIPVKLAFAYENDGKFVKAADMLEGLSQAERDDALARQMLWRSAELREKGDRRDLAVATFERYLKRYPAPLEKAAEVRQMLADMAGKANDIATRDRWLNEIIASARSSTAASGRVRFLAASAAVTFGDVRSSEFETVKLRLPLDKSLAGKRRAMEAALKWYEEAGRFGVIEVTTAATYKTAEIYRTLAKDIMASERPGGLNDLEKEQYGILLEEQASPFEEKAGDLHELNYGRIADKVYDRWVKSSMASLRSLMPARFDKVERVVAFFEYVPPPPKVPEKSAPQTAPAAGGKNAQAVR